MNISRKINQIVLWTLILLCILSVLGLLNFGHGLGNIVYIIPIILLTVLHITLTIIARKKDKNSYYFPMAIIFTIISIGIFYQGTYGRGGEFSWNGEILFLKDVETESTKTTKKVSNTESICNPYFNYDKIEHFYINIAEDKVWDIENKEKKSSSELKLMDLLIQDTSKKISDSTILKDIERIGFTKTEISKYKFEQIDNIFSERNHTEGIAMACIAVYRDILVFKKQNKIIGTAKICFGCKQNIIIGTSLNTSEFGQTGDYEKLEKVLH